MKRYENSLRDLWDNVKCTNIRIIGVWEEEGEKGPEKIFEEITAENFSNMGKKTVTQVEQVQRDPYRMNPMKNLPRHTVITVTKKNYIKKQQVTYKGISTRLSADFFQQKPGRPEGTDTR